MKVSRIIEELVNENKFYDAAWYDAWSAFYSYVYAAKEAFDREDYDTFIREIYGSKDYLNILLTKLKKSARQ